MTLCVEKGFGMVWVECFGKPMWVNHGKPMRNYPKYTWMPQEVSGLEPPIYPTYK